MKLSHSRRAATAWMLYLCILSNLLACAIVHGQYAGLELSGIGGLYCSANGNAGPGFSGDLADTSSAGLSSPFSCALCASAVVSLGLLFVLAWLLRLAPGPAPYREPRGNMPPRHAWPPANPRAPPLH
ncbi:DUF2946 domain-containing protein [Pseudomonas sp. BMS12]|uniref:DUF2946 domain-containing protein n=1 Tax=Pseudomonas sp. BMS12 TaxID=1796033 RepID=UPI000839FC28|nr:DUF2946 domain-containing protein [Pseudomonas sp. BMS12]